MKATEQVSKMTPHGAHITRERVACEGLDPTAPQVELVVLQPWGHGSSPLQTHKKHKELMKVLFKFRGGTA